MKKRLLSTLLALCLCVSLFAGVTPFASAATASGTCGNNLTWSLSSDGTLTISGTGAMYNYDYDSYYRTTAPWGNYASSIKKVVIEPGVVSIGDYAFCSTTNTSSSSSTYKFSNLTSVSIPDSVKTIGKGAFYNCDALTAVTIPSAVTSIGEKAFYDCDALTAISIPDSVITLGASAFGYSYKLATVTVGNGVKSIPTNLFYDCPALTSVTLGSSVQTIGSSAFYNCKKLPSITIPSGVTAISSSTFQNCYMLSEVNLPDSLTSIGSTAFSACESLVEIDLPEALQTIDYGAFRGCVSLEEITIPDSVTTLGTTSTSTSYEYGVFSGCSSLAKATLSSGLTAVNPETFKNCSSLREVVIPKSITSVAKDAFNGCISLSDVYYTGTEEEWSALSVDSTGNSALTSATVHYPYNITVADSVLGTVTVDKTSAMAGETVTITATANEGYDLTAIFVNGQAIEGNTFTMPESDVTVEAEFISVYTGTCGENIEWSFADGILTISGSGAMPRMTANDIPWYHLRLQVKEVVIEDGITQLGATAFYNCSNLTSVTIPDSVAVINNSVFYRCGSLAEITIPRSVIKIGDYAFSSTALTKMNYEGFEDEWALVTIGSNNDPLLNAEKTFKTLTLAEPTASVASGNVEPGALITLSAEDGCEIYYTVNGSDEILYTDAIEITEDITITAYATKKGFFSEVATFTYTILIIQPPFAPTADVVSGEVEPGALITLSAETDCEIYYTVNDGEEILYTEPIEITEDTTITAYAMRDGVAGEVATFTYTILIIQPPFAPTADVASGEVEAGTLVTLSAETDCEIYYTVNDGEETLYTDAIAITEDTVLTAYAMRDGVAGEVATFTYTVKETEPEVPVEPEVPADAPIVKLGTGKARSGRSVTVALSIENNSGLAGMALTLDYDDALTLTEIAAGDALASLDFSVADDVTIKPLKLLWDGVDADTTNGDVLFLTFAVSETAEEGFYNISVSYDENDVYDADLNNVTIAVEDGGITVKNYTLGDVNDDGFINGKDVTLIRRHILGTFEQTIIEDAADVNLDGIINGKDVTLIRRYILGTYGVELE